MGTPSQPEDIRAFRVVAMKCRFSHNRISSTSNSESDSQRFKTNQSYTHSHRDCQRVRRGRGLILLVFSCIVLVVHNLNVHLEVRYSEYSSLSLSLRRHDSDVITGNLKEDYYRDTLR